MCKESPPSKKMNESIDELNPFKLQQIQFKQKENEKKLKLYLKRKKFSMQA